MLLVGTYTNVDIVSKIIKSSLKTWKANVMTIKEAKNLTKLSLKELIGSLMTHEIAMKEQEWEVNPKGNLAFKIVHQIKDDDNDEEDKKEIEEYIALIISQL